MNFPPDKIRIFCNTSPESAKKPETNYFYSIKIRFAPTTLLVNLSIYELYVKFGYKLVTEFKGSGRGATPTYVGASPPPCRRSESHETSSGGSEKAPLIISLVSIFS